MQQTLPRETDVPSVRTSAGNAVPLNQRRTSAPPAPQQTVLRPAKQVSQPQPPLDLGEITADRWASLPDPPADEARDTAGEARRRERLRREQEGRAWSE